MTGKIDVLEKQLLDAELEIKRLKAYWEYLEEDIAWRKELALEANRTIANLINDRGDRD